MLAGALGLPTFTAGGMTLYRRLTMIVTDGAVEHAFYPVFPPDQHAQQVLDWTGCGPTERLASSRCHCGVRPGPCDAVMAS